MSIVLAVATSEVVVLKSDGRERAHSGEIINENLQKFSIVGRQCAIGYTGSVSLIKAVLDKASEKSKEYDYTFDTLTVTALSKICQRILIESKDVINTFDSPSINLVFVGLEDGKIIVKSLGTGNNYELADATPTSSNSFRYCSLTSYAADDAIQFNAFYDTNKSLIDNMDNYIKYIATIDDSVNTNISTAVLKRES